MRIIYLALDSPLPANNGLRMRTWATLRALRAEGCRIELICLQAGAESAGDSELRAVCDSVWRLQHSVGSLTQGGDWAGRFRALASPLPYAALRYRCPAVASLIRQLAGCERLDAIVCDTVFAAVNVPDGVAPLVLNHHNIEHRIFDSFAATTTKPWLRCAARLESRKVCKWEQTIGRRTALNLVCSPEDRGWLLAQQPGAAVVVAPNIVEIGDDQLPIAAGDAADADTVLFQGALDWFPNRDAVEFFLASIWPGVVHACPRAKLVIAGRNPPPAFLARHRRHPGVVFTGTVPDLRPLVRRAAVCVVPLRIGSGTRLKILEAAAMGRAIVATPLGAEGLTFTPGTEILLASDPRKFAAAVLRLLDDANLRTALGRGALARVRSHYGLTALRAAVRHGLCMVGGGAPLDAAPRELLPAMAAER
jgi:glycosyltransferase involved in cell wall biosynthesis